MLDKVRRNAFLIAAGFFLWQGWSAAQAQAPEEEVKPARDLPSLSAEFLRSPDSPPSSFDAPQGSETEGVREGEPSTPGEALAASVMGDPFRVLKSNLAKQEAAMAQLGVGPQGEGIVNSPDAAVAAAAQAILQLQSTLKPPRGEATAIINGQILSVGETLSGFDEDHPPLLVEISGTKAVLRYDDQLITLDVAGTASVAVDR